MLKLSEKWLMLGTNSFLTFIVPLPCKRNSSSGKIHRHSHCSAKIKALNLRSRAVRGSICAARRRVRYDNEDEDEDEEYGHNEQITMLESYSQSATGEALIVHATVDDEEVEVLIFKGFSSCLSNKTSPDPSKSVLPARAVINSIDRIKGPFDPANIEYLQQGITWESFSAASFT